MRSRIQLPIHAVLLSALFFSSFALAFFSQTIEVSQQQLQAQLDAVGPLRHQESFITVSVENPHVLLTEDSDKLGFTGLVETVLFGNMKANAHVELRGNVVYRAENGAFFISNVEVVNLTSEQIPPQQVPNVKRIVASMMNQLLDKQPVYTLNEAKTEEKLAKAVLKDVSIENGKLLLTLSAF